MKNYNDSSSEEESDEEYTTRAKISPRNRYGIILTA